MTHGITVLADRMHMDVAVVVGEDRLMPGGEEPQHVHAHLFMVEVLVPPMASSGPASMCRGTSTRCGHIVEATCQLEGERHIEVREPLGQVGVQRGMVMHLIGQRSTSVHRPTCWCTKNGARLSGALHRHGAVAHRGRHKGVAVPQEQFTTEVFQRSDAVGARRARLSSCTNPASWPLNIVLRMAPVGTTGWFCVQAG